MAESWQNVSWLGLLLVSAMHEQQARMLIHSRDSPASSRFECGLAHACEPINSCMVGLDAGVVTYMCTCWPSRGSLTLTPG